MSELKQSAQAVQDALASSGLDCEVVELPRSTRTAREAAEAVGCTVAQIAKSIVFRAPASDRAVLVVASGVLWAAAGTPNAVFRIASDQLAALTGGEVLRIA